MQAYNRIYESIVNTKPGNGEWKAKVDATIKKFREGGLTQTQAIKHAVMELNTETTVIPTLDCIFLKEFVAGERRLANLVMNDGSVGQMEIPSDFQEAFPPRPAKAVITNVRRNRLLLTDKTTYQFSPDTTIKTTPVKTAEIVERARTLDALEDGEWGLIRANATALIAWDEDNIITPERVNLKLNVTSGNIRSGIFLRTLDEVRQLLPTDEDASKLDDLVAKGRYTAMMEFVNDIVQEQRDYGMPGAELLVYAQCQLNTFKGRNGQDITGKNLRTGLGGFCINIERLISAEDTISLGSFDTVTVTPKVEVTIGDPVTTDGHTADTTPVVAPVVRPTPTDDAIPTPTVERKSAPPLLKEMVLATIKRARFEGVDSTDISQHFPKENPQDVSDALQELWGEKKISLSKAQKFIATDGE